MEGFGSICSWVWWKMHQTYQVGEFSKRLYLKKDFSQHEILHVDKDSRKVNSNGKKFGKAWSYMLWANQVTRFINKLWYIKMKSINHCFFACKSVLINGITLI